MIIKFAVVILALGWGSDFISANPLHTAEFQPQDGGARMSTNIALFGSKEALGGLTREDQHHLAVIDPTGWLDDAAKAAAELDIEEDPNDPFITTRKGKRRLSLDWDSEWADERPVSRLRKLENGPQKVLSRKKRCGGGGGGGDDDDGNARRSRRARRARRTRARRVRRQRARAAKSSTTTVTRKVIQNGQVVSQTTETQGATVASPQPGRVIVQQQPGVPVVQHEVQQPHPVVVQQQPVASPAVAVPSVPSISVNGSIKVN